MNGEPITNGRMQAARGLTLNASREKRRFAAVVVAVVLASCRRFFKRNVVLNDQVSHPKPALPLGGMLPAYLRQILWRLEFNRDVLLNLDRPFVQEGGPVTPLANGAHGSRKKRVRAAHQLYIQHLAELPDGGADLYGFCRSIAMPCS
jgi:hypothetical protein